jgi:hypothetical protein
MSFIPRIRSLNKRGFMNIKNAFCALFSLAIACFGQPQYSVTPILSPTGDNNYVVWVSDDGSTTIGYLVIAGPTQTINQCYTVKNGQFTPYATPGLSCVEVGVNKSLQFAGTLGSGSSPFTLSPYLNTNGTFTPFGSLISGYETQARGIDDNGDVVGVAVGGNPLNFGWLYSGGQITVLPANFYPVAISNYGIAGSASPSGNWDPNNSDAAIYRGGNITILGTLSTMGGGSFAQRINSSGQVSGYFLKAAFNTQAPSAPIPEPFFYDGTTMNAINIANAAYGGYADYLNDSGAVVGRYYPDNLDACFNNSAGVFTCNFTHRAFYYSNGTAVDLNSLVMSPPAGMVLRDVFYISNSGLILAGSPNAQGTGEATFLLTPVSPAANTGTSPSTAAITASPDPAIHTANGDAITTISWNAPSGVTAVEVHLLGPTGPLFTTGGPAGAAVTGPWVSNGMTFYLQDASNGTGSNSTTLGTVVVTVQ